MATTAAYMKISVSASGKVILSDDTAGGVAVLDPGCTFYGIADASYEVVSRINPGCVLNAPQLLQTLTSLNLFSSHGVLFGLLHRMKCVAKQREKKSVHSLKCMKSGSKEMQSMKSYKK